MSITFTRQQAESLLSCFGGDEKTTITVMESDEGHSGPGLYAVCDGCEDEGAFFLSANFDTTEAATSE